MRRDFEWKNTEGGGCMCAIEHVKISWMLDILRLGDAWVWSVSAFDKDTNEFIKNKCKAGQGYTKELAKVYAQIQYERFNRPLDQDARI